MTEWEVVGVIVVLVGLVAAFVGPIIRLNTNITKLTVTMERLAKDMDVMQENSHDAHKRLWDHNDEQDKTLNDHETRISTLERK